MATERNGLTGKVVVITGASSGFGRGMALAFARAGADVVVAARRDEVLDEVARECQGEGVRALAVGAAVSRKAEVEDLARQALVAMGRIDVWVNNAGVGALGRFEDVPLDIHEQVIATDLLGVLYGSYFAYRQMLEQRSGVLINIASELGRHTVPYYASYAAAKHGVVGLTRAIRQELELAEGEGVHVCLVMPTAHDTPFFDHAANYTGHEIQAPEPLHDPQDVIDAVVAIARDPKDEKIVGGDGVVKILLERLAPDAESKLAAKQMHKTQVEDAPLAADTSGAVKSPMQKGTDVDAHRA
ncbi:MAG: SDR family NAD(P)-dependent oxidoreductase [Deltaproteobacteria bacterium]|nr:SDR family NAD(P)-dependent oxidoreductase [Deltaproteobacteria bacterium]